MAGAEEIRRSVWHAFVALANSEDGQVAKSRLKVLTNSIGRAQGSEKAEEIVEEANTDSNSLTFSEYFTIISPKLFLFHNLTPSVLQEINKICWMLSESSYQKKLKLTSQNVSFTSSEDLFKLWQLFNFLARVDLDASEDRQNLATLPLRIDIEEAHRLASIIRQAVGLNPSSCPVVDPTEAEEEEPGARFSLDFVDFVVTICTATLEQGLTGDVLRQGIDCVREEILNDIIKKGYMDKFGNQVTNWKRRWFRLSAKELKYFTTDMEKETKGTIEVCASFKPESMPQRSGTKPFRIKLSTAGKSFELSAPDLRNKNEWMIALQKAADHTGNDGSYQKSELMKRERARKTRRDKISEELSGKSMMRKQLKNRDEQLELELQEHLKDKSLLEKREKELEAERLARLDVEARLAEEAAALEAERLRLKELEEIRAMLERLLEEERQAKHDEEIVRGLQARLLLEETEKREQLEELRQEQDRLLQQEREEKEGLERQQQQQQEMLSQAQLQLNLLTDERQRAEEQFKEAEEKIRLAEVERRKIEERLRLRQMSTSVSLKKPKPVPDPDLFVTHRGKGAFVEADFAKPGTEENRQRTEDSLASDDSETFQETLEETTTATL